MNTFDPQIADYEDAVTYGLMMQEKWDQEGEVETDDAE